jgi:hypothetical protein
MLSDMQDVDADVHRSLLWLLENDIADGVDMVFAVDHDSNGEAVTHELVPGGSEIKVLSACRFLHEVNNENKAEFVRLMVEWRLSRGTESQMAALLMGLHEIVPRPAILQFTEQELEFLISGTQQLDLVRSRVTRFYPCSLHGDIPSALCPRFL